MSSSPTAKEKNHKPPTPLLVSLISGGVAGGAEGLITYLFEFAKTRVQLGGLPGSLSSASSSQSHKKPIPDHASHLQSEGLRVLYKGCGALVTGSVSKDAVRFLCFDTVKNAFKDRESGALRPWRDMLAGMTAGVVTSVCAVTPMELIKTALSDDAGQGKRCTSNIHCIRTIIQEDGFKGLYFDLVGTLKQASATSFRVGTYNIIKHFEEIKGVQLSMGLSFYVAVAGIITTVLSQSFDTVKTRSQSARATATMQGVGSVLVEDEGWGFWKGTVVRLSRTVFNGGEGTGNGMLESCLQQLKPLLKLWDQFWPGDEL